MVVYVLTENAVGEGGVVRGVYSTEMKAREEAPKSGGGVCWTIVPVEVDRPQACLDWLLAEDPEPSTPPPRPPVFRATGRAQGPPGQKLSASSGRAPIRNLGRVGSDRRHEGR